MYSFFKSKVHLISNRYIWKVFSLREGWSWQQRNHESFFSMFKRKSQSRGSFMNRLGGFWIWKISEPDRKGQIKINRLIDDTHRALAFRSFDITCQWSNYIHARRARWQCWAIGEPLHCQLQWCFQFMMQTYILITWQKYQSGIQ